MLGKVASLGQFAIKRKMNEILKKFGENIRAACVEGNEVAHAYSLPPPRADHPRPKPPPSCARLADQARIYAGLAPSWCCSCATASSSPTTW